MSVHYYPSAGFFDEKYPGEFEDPWQGYQQKKLNKEVMQEEFFRIAQKAIDFRRPLYVGEFGSVYWNTQNDVYRIGVNADLISIMKSVGAHYTIWTYKDGGIQGVVTVNH